MLGRTSTHNLNARSNQGPCDREHRVFGCQIGTIVLNTYSHQRIIGRGHAAGCRCPAYRWQARSRYSQQHYLRSNRGLRIFTYTTYITLLTRILAS
jgi:hypothetical protein